MLAGENNTTQGQTVSELLDGKFIIPAKDVLLIIIQFMELTLDLHQQKTHGNISIDNLVIHKAKDMPPVVSLRDRESVPASASNDIYTNVRDVAIVIKTMLEHESIKDSFKTESENIKELQQDFLGFANDTITNINVEQMASAEVLHHLSEQQFEESFTKTVKEMKEAFDELYPADENIYDDTDVYITIFQRMEEEAIKKSKEILKIRENEVLLRRKSTTDNKDQRSATVERLQDPEDSLYAPNNSI